MDYTVRLCRDATGWFATMGPEPVSPSLIRAQVQTDDAREAQELLNLAQDAARRLDRQEDEARVARLTGGLQRFGERPGSGAGPLPAPA